MKPIEVIEITYLRFSVKKGRITIEREK